MDTWTHPQIASGQLPIGTAVNLNFDQLETIMAPPKTAKNNDAKITDYFRAEKKPKRSKAKNPLTEEQKLKRFQGSALRYINFRANLNVVAKYIRASIKYRCPCVKGQRDTSRDVW